MTRPTGALPPGDPAVTRLTRYVGMHPTHVVITVHPHRNPAVSPVAYVTCDWCGAVLSTTLTGTGPALVKQFATTDHTHRAAA